MKSQTIDDEITAILEKGTDLTMDDAIALDFLAPQFPYEDACRVYDAVRLIICDPLYKGEVPFDYFDDAE